MTELVAGRPRVVTEADVDAELARQRRASHAGVTVLAVGVLVGAGVVGGASAVAGTVLPALPAAVGWWLVTRRGAVPATGARRDGDRWLGAAAGPARRPPTPTQTAEAEECS